MTEYLWLQNCDQVDIVNKLEDMLWTEHKLRRLRGLRQNSRDEIKSAVEKTLQVLNYGYKFQCSQANKQVRDTSSRRLEWLKKVLVTP